MCNIDEYIGKWSGTTEFNFEKLEDAIYNMYSLEIEKKTLKTVIEEYKNCKKRR